MNQLLEHIEKHPSETQRLLGLSYDQLIGLITHASSLYDRHQKLRQVRKYARSNQEEVAHQN